MERPRRHQLLLLVVVLGLVDGAAEATGVGCDAADLARRIWMFCSLDVRPTAPCCNAIASTVHLGCICPILLRFELANTPLNTTSQVMALYTSCRGRLITGVNDFAADCQGPSPSSAVPVIAPPPPVLPSIDAPPPPSSFVPSPITWLLITLLVILATFVLAMFVGWWYYFRSPPPPWGRLPTITVDSSPRPAAHHRRCD